MEAMASAGMDEADLRFMDESSVVIPSPSLEESGSLGGLPHPMSPFSPLDQGPNSKEKNCLRFHFYLIHL